MAWQPTEDLDVNFKYTHSDQERTGSTAATALYLTPAQRDALVPNRSAFASAAYALNDINFPELS